MKAIKTGAIVLVIGLILYGVCQLQDTDNQLTEEEEIKKDIRNAETISDILEMQLVIQLFCQKKNIGDFGYQDEEKCKKDLMEEIKEAGDNIKEILVKEVEQASDEEKISKIIELRAILSAGENASGEGVLFSTDNIAWAREKLKKEADAWLLRQINNLSSLTGDELKKRIEELKALMKAFETASGEEGEFFSNDVIKKARGQLEKTSTSTSTPTLKTKTSTGQEVLSLIIETNFEKSLNANEIPEEIIEPIFEINIEEIENLMIGKWNSFDDAKSTVFYNDNFTVVNIYDEQEVSEGTWTLKIVDGHEILLTVIIQEEEYLYSVADITPDNLELIHLNRGNILRYNKIID